MAETLIALDEIRGRYGAWGLVAGGTEGLGLAYAETLAQAGLNIILVARRLELLQSIAADLVARFGVEVLPVAIDLALPDATARLVEATGERDLGVVVFNAGGDKSCADFLDQDTAQRNSLIARNVHTLTDVAEAFGRRFVARRRGAFLVVCSDASVAGCATVASYCGTKAFGLMLAESLWAEWREFDVDVLAMVIGATDTPTLRSNLTRAGFDPDTLSLAQPAEVAAESLKRLRNGPTFVFIEHGGEPVEADRRRGQVEAGSAFVRGLYGR